MKKIVLMLASVLFLTATQGHAIEFIKEREYTYEYDEARGMEADTFVLCTDCKDSNLNQIYTWTVKSSSQDMHNANDERTVETIPVKAEYQTAATIHFKFDSYRLLRSEKTKVSTTNLIGRDVIVNGYTCTIGKQDYNKKLSIRRAKSVTDYLIKNGVRVLSDKGFGESDKYNKKALNRRVEIMERRK